MEQINTRMFEFLTDNAQPISPDRTCVTELSRIFLLNPVEFPQLKNGMTVGIFNAWGNFTYPFSRNLGSSFYAIPV